jgi:uncharacterized protein (TIGR02118 family)
MAKLVVLYPRPTDTALFDQAYAEEHVPLMQDKLKGTTVAVTSINGAASPNSPFYLMAEIWGPTIDALQAVFSTEDGRALVAHATKISTGGAPTILFTEEEIHQF